MKTTEVETTYKGLGDVGGADDSGSGNWTAEQPFSRKQYLNTTIRNEANGIELEGKKILEPSRMIPAFDNLSLLWKIIFAIIII